MIKACYECLNKDEQWKSRYKAGWFIVALTGLIAFLAPLGENAVYAQGLFFLLLFPQILWPVYASRHIWGMQGEGD